MKRFVWLFAGLYSIGATAAPSPDPDACTLLEPAEVQAALGTDPLHPVPRETWICNWLLASGEQIAQLVLTPAPKATFAEYEAEMASQMGPGQTRAVPGVGDYASWTFGAMLFVKSGDHGIQITPYRNGSPEKAAALAKKVIARLPK